jgi:hypothetical protein
VSRRWYWSDAWLLAAAYVLRKKPVTVAEIREAGDYINHAIFTDEELSGGFGRLSAAGLLQVQGDEISLTEDGRRLCEDAMSTTQFVLDGTDNIHRALQQLAG